MKALVALVALMGVAAVVGFVVAVRGTRDPVPGRLQACVRDTDANLAHGPIELQAARADVEAGAVRETARYRIGDDDALLLTGTRFRMLVLAGRKSPGLGGNVPLEAYRRAGEFAVVAIEVDPVRGQLDACARSVA